MKMNINISIDIDDQELIEIFNSAGYEVVKVTHHEWSKVDHGRFEEVAVDNNCIMIGERVVALRIAFDELYLPRIKDAGIEAIHNIIHK